MKILPFFTLMFYLGLSNLLGQDVPGISIGPVQYNASYEDQDEKRWLNPFCDEDEFTFDIVVLEHPSCPNIGEFGRVRLDVISTDNYQIEIFGISPHSSHEVPFILQGDVNETSKIIEDLETGIYKIILTSDFDNNIQEFKYLNLNTTNMPSIFQLPNSLNKSSAFTMDTAFCGAGDFSALYQIGLPLVEDPNIQRIYVLDDARQNTSDALFDFEISENTTTGLDSKNMYFIERQIGYSDCNAFEYAYFYIPEKPAIEELPFIDDFSFKSPFPVRSNWEDNRQAYVNRNFVETPFTIGVATFDGLNEYGRPYEAFETDNFNVNGLSADTLASLPFCASAIEDIEQASTIFSFFLYEQGLGNKPENDGDEATTADSLFVDFLAQDGNGNQTWVNVIKKAPSVGDTAKIDEEYNFIDLNVANLNLNFTNPGFVYFKEGFQFRFRNTATSTGINDHWHIDYVYLNDGRSIQDSPVLMNHSEYAFVNSPLNLLENYSYMPWIHFAGNFDSEFNNSVIFSVNNHHGLEIGGSLSYRIFDACTNETLDQLSNGANVPFDPAILPYDNGGRNLTSDIATEMITYMPNDDDGVVWTIAQNISNGGNEVIEKIENLSNERVTHNQYFSDFFAYDDGTAERALELYGDGAQFAMEFHLNVADEITGISISFNQTKDYLDVLDGAFEVKVWSEIEVPENPQILPEGYGVNRNQIHSETFNYPDYAGYVNGFVDYKFETPVQFATGDTTIYIGISLVTGNRANIGYDRNNDSRDKFFYDVENLWVPATLMLYDYESGTPMMRMITTGKPIPDEVWLDTDTPQLSDFGTIFPNPVSDVLYFETDFREDYVFEIYDIAGRRLTTAINISSVDVNDYPNGLYFVRIMDEQGKELFHERFVKNR